jgi:hypothetical protein
MHPEGGGVYYPPRPELAGRRGAVDLTDGALWITEGRPWTAAAERFDLGSLVELAG